MTTLQYRTTQNDNTVRAYDSRNAQVAIAERISDGWWMAHKGGDGERAHGDTAIDAIRWLLGDTMSATETDQAQEAWEASNPDDDNGVR